MAKRNRREILRDNVLHDLIAQIDRELVGGPEDIMFQASAMVLGLVGAKLKALKPGQSIVLMARAEIVNSDGTLARVPSARLSPETAEWRRLVFERDGYRCVECDDGGKLNAHHIKSWADHPDLRYDVENGVTLCIECHAKRHPERAHLIRKAKYHRPAAGE